MGKRLFLEAWHSIREPNSINPFIPVGSPIDEENRLALDRVKSISVTLRRERVNGDIVFE